MNLNRTICELFNDYQVSISDDKALAVAKEFKINHTDTLWFIAKEPARHIAPLGMLAKDAFTKFIKDYKKLYRTDRAIKFFYGLSDNEIVSLMSELPWFNKAYEGRETYKPIAENFLKEKIWMDDYPNKERRDRATQFTPMMYTDWETYLGALNPEQRDAVEIFKETMSFDEFKLNYVK